RLSVARLRDRDAPVAAHPPAADGVDLLLAARRSIAGGGASVAARPELGIARGPDPRRPLARAPGHPRLRLATGHFPDRARDAASGAGIPRRAARPRGGAPPAARVPRALRRRRAAALRGGAVPGCRRGRRGARGVVRRAALIVSG